MDQNLGDVDDGADDGATSHDADRANYVAVHGYGHVQNAAQARIRRC